jgi:hypothetical protein
MDDLPITEGNSAEENSALEQDRETLDRRDFLKLAAILTGSTLLLLSRCDGLNVPTPLPDQELPPIPPNFKRFILTKSEQRVTETVQAIAAFGSQCPDWKCTLLWVDQPEFEFYDSVEEIINLHTQEGDAELVWLD